jgi:cullin 1
LNGPLKSVEQKEIEGLHQTIDADREYVIKAYIMRIMKARQTLKQALLMQEVIQQLSSRFKPEIPMIEVNSILNFHRYLISEYFFVSYRNVLIY